MEKSVLNKLNKKRQEKGHRKSFLTSLQIVLTTLLLTILSVNAENKSISAEADSYTQGGQHSKNNFGNETSLKVKQPKKKAKYLRQSYLRFDIGAKGYLAKGAKLRLFQLSSDSKKVLLKLVNNDSWKESTINYENAPSANEKVIASWTPQTNKFVEVDISSVIRQQVDGKVTFVIESQEKSSTIFQFASKESRHAAQRPSIILTPSSNQNSAPTIDTPASAENEVVILPNTAQVSVKASDADGDVLSYTWSKKAGKGSVSFSTNGTKKSSSTAVNFSAPGSYVLEVLVSDGKATVKDTIDIIVKNPEEPKINKLHSIHHLSQTFIGNKLEVDIDYSSSEHGMKLVLRLDSAPWDYISQQTVTVNAKSGSQTFIIPIPQELYSGDYILRAYLTQGNFKERKDLIASPLEVIGSDSKPILVEKIADTVVDPKALLQGDPAYKKKTHQTINGMIGQRQGMISHAGYQYLGYYNAARQVCIARRELPSGDWEVLTLDHTKKDNDDHNFITIGICENDGTLHTAYDMHNSDLYYQVTYDDVVNEPETIHWHKSLFRKKTHAINGGKKRIKKSTYPSFVKTPDGGLHFLLRKGRSGEGRYVMWDYVPGSAGVWENERWMDGNEGIHTDPVLGKSDERSTYHNGVTYGPDGKLHVTWIWREDGNNRPNHDLCYAYSEDNGLSWKNNFGELIWDDTLEVPYAPVLNTPGIVAYEIDEGYGLMNTHSQAVDSEGRIHTVMYHCTDTSFEETRTLPYQERFGPYKATRYVHYWRDLDGTWEKVELPCNVGQRARILIDNNNNVYLVTLKGGKLTIMAASASENWSDWQVVYSGRKSFEGFLVDNDRWESEQILSIMVQDDAPNNIYQSKLRVIDFDLWAE